MLSIIGLNGSGGGMLRSNWNWRWNRVRGDGCDDSGNEDEGNEDGDEDEGGEGWYGWYGGDEDEDD